jgi:hypothetical protein
MTQRVLICYNPFLTLQATISNKNFVQVLWSSQQCEMFVMNHKFDANSGCDLVVIPYCVAFPLYLVNSQLVHDILHQSETEVFQKKKTSHKARCNKIKLTGTSLTKAVASAVPSEVENGTQLISEALLITWCCTPMF